MALESIRDSLCPPSWISWFVVKHNTPIKTHILIGWNVSFVTSQMSLFIGIFRTGIRTTRPLDNSPQTTRPRSLDNWLPIWKHLCYVGQIYFYVHKVIISWKKKKVCFLKYITRPRLTFVAFDCNDRVNTWTWPFRNPATTFDVIEVNQI